MMKTNKLIVGVILVATGGIVVKTIKNIKSRKEDEEIENTDVVEK